MSTDKTIYKIAEDIGKIKGELIGIRNHMKTQNNRLEKYEIRIASNKTAIDKGKGASAIIGAIGGFLSAVALLRISTFFNNK